MRLALHHISIADASFEALIDIAAALDCRRVCTFVRTPRPLDVPLPVVDGVKQAAGLRDRANAAGVSFQMTDTFLIGTAAPEEFEHALAIGQALGVEKANCVHVAGDADAAARDLSRLAAIATAYDISLTLEWSRFAVAKSLAGSVDLLRRVEAPNVGLTVDILHLLRNGDDPADLDTVDAGLISVAQICDGPSRVAEAAAFDETVYNREVPGRGEFPLDRFARALPPGIDMTVEVPLDRFRDTLPPLERARLAVEGARRVLAAAGRPAED